uniref:LOB domain-containing protein 21-like n=1 Tax=Erigeron canadensis TaxID=72917 RepID=UPI001CB88D00|nr:LOB domain-containing protein 21-like [Erigeron canadensis]
MTVKGGSRPACAACRFQRRRCASDCPLAPHFPANQPKMFQNVHRIYGVGNIMKILNQIKDEDLKQDAMKSIKYESYIRHVYRVHGCYGLIAQYRQKCLEAMQELQYVHALLDAFKKNKQVKLMRQNSLGLSSSLQNVDDDECIKDQVLASGLMAPMMNGGNDLLGFYYNNNGLIDHYNMNELPSQYLYDENNLFNPEQGESSIDYSEMTSLGVSFADDQQAFMGPKEAYDFKLESSLKEAKTNFIEPQETKVYGKLFEVQQGVHHMAI